MTALASSVKSQSTEKMHNFLPGRLSLLYVTTWKFCTISKHFLHIINGHQDVSLGWYKILSDNLNELSFLKLLVQDVEHMQFLLHKAACTKKLPDTSLSREH